jgi:hypothetical protein
MTTRRRSSGKRPCSWARPPSTWSPPTPTTSNSSSPWTYVTSFSSPAMHYLRALVPSSCAQSGRQQIIKALQAVSNAPVEIDPLRAKLSSAALDAVLSTENLVPTIPPSVPRRASGVHHVPRPGPPSLTIRAFPYSRSRTRLPSSRGAGTSKQGATTSTTRPRPPAPTISVAPRKPSYARSHSLCIT